RLVFVGRVNLERAPRDAVRQIPSRHLADGHRTMDPLRFGGNDLPDEPAEQLLELGNHARTSSESGNRRPAARRRSSSVKSASGSYPGNLPLAWCAASHSGNSDSTAPPLERCSLAASTARSLAYSFFG